MYVEGVEEIQCYFREGINTSGDPSLNIACEQGKNKIKELAKLMGDKLNLFPEFISLESSLSHEAYMRGFVDGFMIKHNIEND